MYELPIADSSEDLAQKVSLKLLKLHELLLSTEVCYPN